MVWPKIIITIIVVYALSSFYRVVSFMKKLYLITVKALYIVTFPIHHFISLQHFLIHFNFLLRKEVRTFCDGVQENNISQLRHDF
jgi:hypothetical protein